MHSPYFWVVRRVGAAGASCALPATAAYSHAWAPPGPFDGGLHCAGAAKRALAERAAVTLPLPQGSAVVLNTGLLEQAAHPALHRVAKLTMEAIAAAEIAVGDLAGIYCVGGVSRMPLPQKVLTETVGVTPTVVPDPDSAAVWGAADAGAVDATVAGPPVEMPVPPVRRAAAIAVPGLAANRVR
ncbi:Hsp70 family protein [Micromonospora sp. NPDC048999]|uniref:Hsp70 family protein n=1 Tax=Micromonospora sp. NPDC048999 TaxID=3155391 RepID=UPI00340729A1